MSLPAARQGDIHLCPIHGSSPVLGPCCPNVLIGNQFAARKEDFALCKDGGPDAILGGSVTVLMGNKPAARIHEHTSHRGGIMTGCPSVLIGNPPVGPDGKAIAVPPGCAILKNFGSASGKNLDRLRDRYFVSPAEDVWEKIPGDDKPTHLRKRDVYIRGHKVEVYEPASGAPAGTWLPKTDSANPNDASVAKGLATLSDEQLRNTKKVYIVPHDGEPDPSGAYPVADCNPKTGDVRYYPRSNAHPQSDIDWALQHETGHAYSLRELWKDPAKREAWQRAMAEDLRGVTGYGNTNPAEDFAEFMILYAATKGTPCEATGRALFPNRYREMDKLFPNGLPARNPAGAANPI